MRDDEGSRTAEYMALFRALESQRPDETRLFDDPLAEHALSPRYRAALALARLPLGGRAVPRYIDRRWPGPRAAGVVRTRAIDDALLAALDGGVAQVAILGAGFDSRPYRLPGIERARVIELDHPSTQELKRRAVERLRGDLPGHVTLAPIDFNEERLGAVLRRVGFDPAARSFFIWEGVVSYLTPHAVDETLAELSAAAAAGSRLALTYQDRRAIDGSGEFRGAREAQEAVERAGEPFIFGWAPGELPDALEPHGFRALEDVSIAELAGRYLAPLGREEPVSEFYRLAVAERV